ncbi:DEAD/DEAH box helicase [Paraburkholderia phymatum]|uniref:DEAD/DEAH box helicase domain protein n=1 Tax=Paraburkholderia phymatum (strain DSM 17167 / CIP 108236 / LMG 21445 / STM815) TaxID=391038 RepID=B2JIF5_PARP8|nr:DEAD/DEAH box helicase [Paraburkholderia phymatum]ACC70549.1 DEAD/DEAH box helicase domain protein [Paraburkholderia phymatum STM815]
MTSSNISSPLNAIADQALGLDTPETAVQATEPTGPTFAELGLSAEIVSALTAAGYKSPTPVQQRAIPAGIAGRDLLVSSPTGSGKTAAFMLPAIERFAQLQKVQASQPREPRDNNAGGRGRRPQPVARPGLLVLTPTRELAMQVTTAASTYGKHLRRLRTVSILGGVAYGQQLMLLAKNPEILVATPGRLIDHLERGRIDLSQLQMLVLDEADRMLDMGFIDDIDTIVAATPASRQTMLFSATLDGKIGSLTGRLLKEPERIEIKQHIEQRTNIAQTVHYVDDRDHKDRLLDHLLRDSGLDQAIVFTATKSDADMLAGRLADAGFESAALHGDLPQGARNRTIRALRERRVRVLVATDVAARGIDIPGITHVFNYDLPKFAEDYVHRIGRTGRAGRSGTAVSLVHHAEQGALKRIERFVRAPLPVNVVEGFEPRRAPPAGGRGGFGGRGRPGGGNGGRRFGGKPAGYGSREGNGGGYGSRDGNRGGYGARDGGNGGGRSWGDKPAGGNREGGYNSGSREGGYRSEGYRGNREGGYSRDAGYGARRNDGPRNSRRGD